MKTMKDVTVVLGTIGKDGHMVGTWILRKALEAEGVRVAFVGALSSQKEFIDAAIESKADSIWVSSMYGMGRLDCAGMRAACDEAGLKNIILYAGGMLVSSKDLADRFDIVEKEFKEMGFTRAYPPATKPEVPIADLKKDLGIN
jgi:methylaspartate mutase sigma subunit